MLMEFIYDPTRRYTNSGHEQLCTSLYNHVDKLRKMTVGVIVVRLASVSSHLG
jgi:hypothetical protein